MNKALITGITGQDGSYLAELLLEKDYDVYGLIRRTSTPSTRNIDHLLGSIRLVEGDMTDSSSLNKAIRTIIPDEIYNLAAQSHVGRSFKEPLHTTNVNALGTIRLLEAMRDHAPEARFYQASTSELFGLRPEDEGMQNEETPFKPRSPYAAAKLAAHQNVRIARKQKDPLFACSGILFNHESPRRGEEFVTRKITRALAEIELGLRENIAMGNLEARRDWGFAGDYVKAMWMMLQQDEAKDYVIATGETRTVRELIESAAGYFDRTIAWEGQGVDERGYDSETGDLLVTINPDFYRPAEVDYLCGDASLAKQELVWEPTVDFEQLIGMMTASDFDELEHAGEEQRDLSQRVERLEKDMKECKEKGNLE